MGGAEGTGGGAWGGAGGGHGEELGEGQEELGRGRRGWGRGRMSWGRDMMWSWGTCIIQVVSFLNHLVASSSEIFLITNREDGGLDHLN